MAIVSVIKTRISDALNRDDLASYIPTWLEATHRDLQRLWNWDCMKHTYRVLATGVSFTIAAPTDVKEPRHLYRVAGTSLTSPLIPAAGNTLQTPFYEKTDFEEVLAIRGGLQAESRIQDQTIRRKYAYENGVLELVPQNILFDDQFAFGYYRFLPLPADNLADWFTENAFDVLLYKSLLESLPFLGEVDDRAPVWRALLTTAETKLLGHGISLQYGGESLVMRG